MQTTCFKRNTVILLMLALISTLTLVNTIHHDDVNIKLIPQVNYLVVVVALLFINAIIAIFMFLKYFSAREHLESFFMGMAFLAGIFYFFETIVIIQEQIDECRLIKEKANDIAIFYLFRQVSMVFLLLLALCCAGGQSSGVQAIRTRNALFLLCLVPVLILPVMAHNFSSYNPAYSLYLTAYLPDAHETAWQINCFRTVICIWLFLFAAILLKTRMNSGIWLWVAFLALAMVCSNLLLLTLDDATWPVWYISRGIEIASKLLIISAMMQTIFKELTLSTALANYDPLTQIFNRRVFFTRLERLLQNDDDHAFCVMLLDFDHFKRINDRWGHNAGDRVIVTLVDIIKKSLRPDDVFARLGGEEFGILLANTGPDAAKQIAERVRKNVELLTASQKHYPVPEPMTISIGLFCSHSRDYKPSDVMAFADHALYEAKNNGRNQVVVYKQGSARDHA